MRKTRADQILDMLMTADEIEKGGEAARKLCTAISMAKLLCVLPQSVNQSLRQLRDDGKVHIHDWIETVPPMAIWVLGQGEDAPRPLRTKEQKAEYHRLYLKRYRQEQKDGRVAGELDLLSASSRNRTLATIERARQVPQPWFAALPGAGSISSMKEAA